MRNLTISIATLSCLLIAAHSQNSPLVCPNGSKMDWITKTVNRDGQEVTTRVFEEVCLSTNGNNGNGSSDVNQNASLDKKNADCETKKPKSTSNDVIPAGRTLESLVFSDGKTKPRLLMKGKDSSASSTTPPTKWREDLAKDFTPSNESVFVIDVESALLDPKSFLDKLNILLQKMRKLIISKREAIKSQNLWADYFGARTETLKKASMFFLPVCLVKGSTSQSVCLALSVENIYLIYGFVPASVPTESSTFSSLLREGVKRRLLFFDRRSRSLVGKSNLKANDIKSGLEPSIYAALGLFAANPTADPAVLFNNIIPELKVAAIPQGPYGPKSTDLSSADAFFSNLFQFVSGKELNSVENAKNISVIEFWAKLLAESSRNQNFFESCRKGPASFEMPGGAVPWDASAVYAPLIKDSRDPSLVEKLKNANTKGKHFLINHADGLNLISIYQ